MRADEFFHQKKQALIIFLSLFTFFGLLILQFYRLQIKEGEKWTKQALSQHQILVSDPPKRGVFYSNTTLVKGLKEDAQPLVVDVLFYHVHIDCLAIPVELKKEVALKISEFLKPEVFQEDILKQLEIPSRNRKIARFISKDQLSQLMVWWKEFSKKQKLPQNAVFSVKDYRRSYPFGKMLGQLLHTIRDEKDPVGLQAIPTGGLEMQFDSILRGKIGKKLLLRSPRHAMDTENVLVEKEDGADIYLTVNHVLQAIVEDELEKGVKKVNGKGGFVVMMDPASGEILALAQYPFFNPQEYKTFYNHPEMITHTAIKSIAEAYEPGSIMKAITVSIALMANDELKAQGKPPLFNPHEMMPCADGTFPGRGPLKDTRFHRYLNMNMAIQKSSNIYVARLVERMIKRLGAKWYRDKLTQVFGFGSKTGIEIAYEHPGFVPGLTNKYPNGQPEWSTPTPFSLAMGYNILVNAIQMVKVYALFANGGYLVEPTLIRKIVKKRGDTIEVLCDHEQKLKNTEKRYVIKKDIVNQVNTAMKFVTKPGGGAAYGEVYGFTEGGKTSTAEKLINGIYSKKIHFTTFVGIVPMSNPRFVMLVAVDEPESKYIPGFGTTHFGGKCAAPIFSAIAKKALNYLGEKPDDPYGYPKGDPRSDLKKADWIKETLDLADEYKKWNKENSY